jgi:hypothetical protein
MGIEISALCDRKTTNVAKSQIGFIDFVVMPYFSALAGIIPDMKFAVSELKSNKSTWSQLVDDYEKKKEETANEGI